MARFSTLFLSISLGALLGCAVAPARASEGEARVGKRICLPQAETREEIKSHHLLEPFTVLKSAAAQFKAEALSAKLCRIGDELVYDIALLHRDGRFVHAVMNATTGKFIEWRHVREAMPKN